MCENANRFGAVRSIAMRGNDVGWAWLLDPIIMLLEYLLQDNITNLQAKNAVHKA